MRAAVDAVTEAEGAVGVLVNNAGYSQSGAVETVPIEDARRQFETNVFGLLADVPAGRCPAMRAQHWGKIVNLSSMGGRLTFPGGGLYHATKYSVEAISDALRFEVRGFGVDVILIEPGLIVTNFGEVAAAVGRRRPATAGRTPISTARSPELTEAAYKGPMARLGAGPDAVAKAIERAISARRPRAALPGHRQRAPDDRAAAADPRPRLGPDDAHTVPPAEGVTARGHARAASSPASTARSSSAP